MYMWHIYIHKYTHVCVPPDWIVPRLSSLLYRVLIVSAGANSSAESGSEIRSGIRSRGTETLNTDTVARGTDTGKEVH